MDNFNLNKKVELLSPAGTYEAFKNAIDFGADAVYLAGDRFGARAYAGNFSETELLNALDYAHLYGKHIYLTVNTVLKQNEIDSLYDYILPFYENGLDGVIVQDMGVASVIAHFFEDLELHASTQMSITDVSGALLLKNNGFKRIVPARELSLREISNIYDKTHIDIECFIHGAMCYSYSGKCLFSSFLGDRSGNRGRCAQPCRMEYNGTYPLSMKDMCTLRIIPELIEAGIASFKIEGRMKSPEYVAGVTSIYRKYIDMYYENSASYNVIDEDERFLLDSYTRSGNCRGYYHQHNGKNMITFETPAYNGEHSSNLKINKSVSKIKISGFGSFLQGHEAQLTVNLDDIYITENGGIVDKAVNNPTSEDVIKHQLLKTGNEEFDFCELTLSADNNIFVPMGQINSLRRKAIKSLYDEVLKRYRRITLKKNDISFYNEFKDNSVSTIGPYLSVTSTDRSMLDYLLTCPNIDEVIVPSEFLINKDGTINDPKLDDKIKIAISNGMHIAVKLPYILRDSNASFKTALKEITEKYSVKIVIVCNFEEIEIMSELDFKGEIIAGEHLYCLNVPSLNSLKNLGVGSTTVPLELNRKELILRNIHNENLIVYGRMPLMISAGCVRKSLKNCDKKETLYYLKDRKNIKFPVRNICNGCSNIVYNSVPTLIDKDDEIIQKLNPRRMIMSFTDEDKNTIESIIKYYAGIGSNPDIEYTRGHLNRGIQ